MSSTKSRGRQRGFSLAEVLVATAILVIVLVGILTLYDRANRVFKSGNEAAEMQQNVRIAYERMVSDIRMAGFDYKRGGPLLPGQTAAAWAPNRAYSAGTIVTPTSPNGHTYRSTGTGTSGGTEPSWPLSGSVDETTATPPITWQENGGAVYEQPDEQIEYAGATALTVRGNLNYSVNPTVDDHGRENGAATGRPNLESSQFPIVTTGNDEIVTYALAKTGVAAGTAPNNQSITMYVDLHVPRSSYPGGAAENQKVIDGIDLTNANPPYTLYRFTFDQNTGNLVRTPLAENIRSLNFFYYEDVSAKRPLTDTANPPVFAPDPGGDGQFDPAVAGSINAAGRLIRKKIRSVRVRLVGMNSQPDVNYTDTSLQNGQFASNDTAGFPTFTSDTAADQYRRLTVDTLITPRNLGMTGLPQNFLQPPVAPTVTNVCIGYCGIAVVNWDPNTNSPNASYIVMWDTSSTGDCSTCSFSNTFDAGTSNTFAIDLTQQDLSQTFYFRVRAVNAGGTANSTNAPDVSAHPTNATVPNPPVSIQASGNGTIPPISNKVHLTWSAPITVASGSPSCVGPVAGTPSVTNYLREIKGFRIFRNDVQNFTSSGTVAGTGNCILDENASGSAAPHSDGYGNYTWDDLAATCGVTQYYRLETVEWCVAQGNYNTSLSANDSVSAAGPADGTPGIRGRIGSGGPPAAPQGLEVSPLAPNAYPTGFAGNSVCTYGMNNCNPIRLRWQPVTFDTATPTPNPVSIDQYRISRTQKLNGIPVTTTTTLISGALSMIQSGGYVVPPPDTAPMYEPATGLDYTYEYQVQAVQQAPCPNGAYSTPPVIFPPPCSFTGSVFVVTGALSGNGLTPASAWVLNNGDTIQVQPPAGTTFIATSMQIFDPSGTMVAIQQSFTSPANFTWVDLTPGTPYTVTFTMTDNGSPVQCTEQLVRYITQQGLPACSLTTFVDSSILIDTATDYQMQLDLRNSAPENLTLTGIDFTWDPLAPSLGGGAGFRTFNSIQFVPSNDVVGNPLPTIGLAPNPVWNQTLFPRPGTVSVSDVTVPANSSRRILLNFAQFGSGHPNPRLFPAAAITDICVHYTAPSVNSFTFACKIKPDQQPANPNLCQ